LIERNGVPQRLTQQTKKPKKRKKKKKKKNSQHERRYEFRGGAGDGAAVNFQRGTKKKW